MNSERRGVSLFGPLLLIAFGVLFLLNNMGVIAVDVWELLFRFWPVLLIAAGLDILLGRRTGVGAVIALLVILVLAGGGLWFGGIGNVNAGNLPSQTIRQNLEDAEKAVVTISPGVSRLTVGGFLTAGQLIQGEIQGRQRIALMEIAQHNLLFRLTSDRGIVDFGNIQLELIFLVQPLKGSSLGCIGIGQECFIDSDGFEKGKEFAHGHVYGCQGRKMGGTCRGSQGR